MSWLSRLKIQMDNVEGERNTVRFFDIEWEELDRFIEIVERAMVGDHCHCNICDTEYPEEEGHTDTCPYSDEWVKS